MMVIETDSEFWQLQLTFPFAESEFRTDIKCIFLIFTQNATQIFKNQNTETIISNTRKEIQPYWKSVS